LHCRCCVDSWSSTAACVDNCQLVRPCCCLVCFSSYKSSKQTACCAHPERHPKNKTTKGSCARQPCCPSKSSIAR
jgi:hypothetical protein